MMKIAYFSPLPPQPTGIAHYSAGLLSHLAQLCDLTAYTTAVPLPQTGAFPVRPLTEFHDRWQYDACLYHMGNHPRYHEAIYTTAVHYPGIVVLHEVNLHAYYLLRDRAGHQAAYVREMGYAQGTAGANVARQTIAGIRQPDLDNESLLQRLARLSLGLIVHTDYARRKIVTAVPRTRVACIPLAVHIPPATAVPHVTDPWLAQLPPDTILLGSFGYVAASKRIEPILRALALLRSTLPDFRYVIVGESVAGYDLTPILTELKLHDIVHQTGYTTADNFEAYLRRVDIGLNLRTGPTGGEMSGTLVRLLAHGKPVLVSNVDGFAEFPDHCVIKIEQNHQEEAQLVSDLRRLMTNPAERRQLGEAARAFVRTHYAFPQVARQYVDFIQACIGGGLV